MKKNLCAAHLPVVAAPIVPSWHAFGVNADVAVAVAVAGAAQGVTVTTVGTSTVLGDKRTTSRMVDPAPSSPPV